MRTLGCIAGILIWAAGPAVGALRFGLGQAVAERSAELINQAGDAVPRIGDAVAGTLSSCPAGELFSQAPTDISRLRAIEPLGHVAPSPHTFPSDHMNIYASTTSNTALPLYAPATLHLTRVASATVLSATPVFTDYTVYFYACREVKMYFGHVRTLAPAIESRLGRIDQNCSTYTTGATYYGCYKDTDIVIQAGDLIGYTAVSGAFDLGAYDFRRAPLTFISPARHGIEQPYAVCPLDYFSSNIRTDLEALLGRADGGFRRTTAPICGQILFDVAGSVKGTWFYPGSPDSPEDPHVALIDDNVYAPKQTISIGTSLPNQAPAFYAFVATSAGLVNRDFAQVVDASIYCYDSFYDPAAQPITSGPTFLIQLLSATTLRIESQSATSCGAGPWAFTSNAVTFER